MLEDKTANNVVKRYHRIVTGDQNQIELGIIPSGTIKITENGTGIDVAQYATADVNAGITPTGVMNIHNNEENIDVTDIAIVNVDVPATKLLMAQFGSLDTMTDENIEKLAQNTPLSGVKIYITGTMGGFSQEITMYGDCNGYDEGGDGSHIKWYAAQSYGEDGNGGGSGFRCILKFEKSYVGIDPGTGEPEYSYSATLVQAELYLSGTWTDVSSLLTITGIAISTIQE